MLLIRFWSLTEYLSLKSLPRKGRFPVKITFFKKYTIHQPSGRDLSWETLQTWKISISKSQTKSWGNSETKTINSLNQISKVLWNLLSNVVKGSLLIIQLLLSTSSKLWSKMRLQIARVENFFQICKVSYLITIVFHNNISRKGSWQRLSYLSQPRLTNYWNHLKCR